MNYAPTLGAVRWLERGRVFEFLEIVLVRAEPDVHFRLETLATFLAILPASRVPLVEMRTAQCVAVVVAVAGVVCV